MQKNHWRWATGALSAAALVMACRSDRIKVERANRGKDVDASFSKRDTVLGPGDIRIVNADSSIELALVGDSVVTGLGPKVIQKVREKTDTAAVGGNGLGASIEKFVKNTVADALAHQIKYSVKSIGDVRYEGGKIQFYATDGSKLNILEKTKDNDRPASETFRPADAQAFVAAFKARKAGGT